jgi:hypothetical protein
MDPEGAAIAKERLGKHASAVARHEQYRIWGFHGGDYE